MGEFNVKQRFWSARPDESGSPLFWFLIVMLWMKAVTSHRTPKAFDEARPYVIASLALRLRLLK